MRAHVGMLVHTNTRGHRHTYSRTRTQAPTRATPPGLLRGAAGARRGLAPLPGAGRRSADPPGCLLAGDDLLVSQIAMTAQDNT